MEKISIIVPIYNLEKYVGECIESIINQTYKNIEVILVDDGSLDNSFKVCKKYSEIDDRIIVIQQKNSGVSVARNTGLKKSTGQWVMFIDPDDYIVENAVESLYNQTKIYGEAEIIACCCNVFTTESFQKNSFFDGNKIWKGRFEGKKDLFYQLMDMQHGQPNKALTAIGVPWGKIYKKELITRNKLEFKPTLRRMQDNIFNSYAFWYAKQIVYIDLPLYCYRFEHFNKYESSFNKNIDYNFLNVIKERRIFLEYIGVFNEVEVKKAYYYESFKYITAIINRKILHKEYNISYMQRLKEMSKLCRVVEFEEVIKDIKISNIPTLKHKLEALVLKMKLYFIFEMGIRINTSLKLCMDKKQHRRVN